MSRLVFIGLSLSSSWGNGHATTFRALIKGLATLGHEVAFLERDVPWYASNRDMPYPDFCTLHLYRDVAEITVRFAGLLAEADGIVIGSYVPDGPAVTREVLRHARGALAFYDIDTPVTLAGLEAGTCAYLTREDISLFDVYFSFTGGPVLEHLEQVLGARRAVMLPCGVDPDHYYPTGAEVRWDLGYLGTYSDDRQPTLERLMLEPARRRPDLRFVVAGPQYPETIDWPQNVERIDHLPPSEHAAFYSAQRYTLNVTRADMVRTGYAPSVRLFETAACGTPAISDSWEGIGDFFTVGKSILLAQAPEDVLAALDDSDDVRVRRSQEARREALSLHTGRARAETLLAALNVGDPKEGSARAAE